MKNFLCLFACFAMLASCSTSHKVKQSVFKKSDSTGTSIAQASGTRSIDSSKSRVTKQSHKDGITINFAEEDELDISAEDPVEKAKDLAGRQQSTAGVKIKKSSGAHTVNIDGKVITSDRPIRSIDITSAGKTSTTDISQFAKKDSGQEFNKQSVAVAKEEEKKSKDVDRHGASVGIWIGIAVTLVFGFIIAARFGVFKKKNFDA